MQRLKLLGLTLLAVFAIASIASASAMAEGMLPTFLPTGTEANPVTFTAKGTTAELVETNAKSEKLKAVVCEKSGGSGEARSAKLGKFTTIFEGCKETELGTKCLGLGDTTAGNITVTGEFHLRGSLDGTGPLIVFLQNHTHFSCASGLALFLVLGCVIGRISPANTLTSELKVLLKAVSGTNWLQEVMEADQEENDSAMEACLLKIKKGSETGEGEGTEIAHIEISNFKQNSVAVTALIHV